ncbi:hypothetical protein GLW08_06050 [Pontibacillus yanchengensis]|uniref:Uncharacterized protein n=2 Tax=Pontibacillus yanchengensis TaxID=462910 RepID=A0ACC7VD61_9BACI|nr:hypothetical protein [Pontibacillus yanchengensis]MYL32318.1 hypothetical protein [Pontibacillus yanchengensis]MYL52898.1 hypothetical protein [Pontibacillus yanchengensis]
MKLASDLDISSGRIVDMLDLYREHVAPLAEKWKEWKDTQVNSEEDPSDSGSELGANEDDEDSQDGAA